MSVPRVVIKSRIPHSLAVMRYPKTDPQAALAGLMPESRSRFVAPAICLMLTLASAMGLVRGGEEEQVLMEGASALWLPASQTNAGLARITRTKVSGQSFAEAVRVEISQQPGHPYSVQLSGTVPEPVRKNDMLTVVFWLRAAGAEAGSEAKAELNFEQRGVPYTKSVTVQAVAGTEWKRFEASFRPKAHYPSGGAHITVRLGFKAQTVEFGGFTLVRNGAADIAVRRPPPASVDDGLAELEKMFSGFLPWLARVYDPVSGGFYESVGLREGREDRAYGPDIQSTHFAISMLSQSGALKSQPTNVRDGFVDYFLSRQDPQTGYFVDPDYPEMKDDPRTLGRALSFSRVELRRFGVAPRYPLPGTKAVEPPPASPDFGDSSRPPEQAVMIKAGQMKMASVPLFSLFSILTKGAAIPNASSPNGVSGSPVPAHLATVEAFRVWLDKRPWHFSWTAIDEIQSQATLILLQEPTLRDALIDEALRSIVSRTEPETGLVRNGGEDIVRISGGFKLVLFCDAVKRPVPFADQLWDSVLGWFRSDPETDHMCFIRNAVDMLDGLIPITGHKLTQEELLQVIHTALVEMDRFRCADGAFSLRAGQYYISPNDLYLRHRRIARAGPQSDVNGTMMAWRLREKLYRLAGRPVPLPAAPADYKLVR